MKRLCLAISILLGAVLGYSEVLAQIHTARAVVGSGAQQSSTNGTYRIAGTFGQAIIGTEVIADRTLYGGFWGPMARTSSTTSEHSPVAGSALEYLEIQATTNPFTTTTELWVDLPKSGEASVRLYDGLGREVRALLVGEQSSGHHRIVLDSEGLSSGSYVVNVVFGGEQKSVQLLLVQ